MKLLRINPSILDIPFKESFKHASAERVVTQTLWVKCETAKGINGFGEGCPREYVSGESLESALAFVAQHHECWLAEIDSVDALRAWIKVNRVLLDANPAAWSAVELAMLDALGIENSCSIEKLLGLPELCGDFLYTAVLGDASTAKFQSQLERYQTSGFTEFKIKLSGNLDLDKQKIAVLRAAGVPASRVRADANNLWPDVDSAVLHMKALNFAFMGLEEPIRAGSPQALRQVAVALGMKIILDESLLRLDQICDFEKDPQHWVVNVRISKMGGILRSLEMLSAIRRVGFGLIVGAHVGETSVLTRAALTVVNQARDILIAQEGAFGTHLLTHDVMEKPLMFGHGGVLEFDARGKPGLGIDVRILT
ncbi:MAG: enolase C-terminal domain-like protein [Herminiimonas sp.]|uniref:mandelate racemase/muconate lactonizing enzyme family protein n=1 Tax=Herminiimonas sp. TaxID=1926289 RepID=UPI0027270B49|nr:enolase C-terminal domain-like protein [Herminiimonas sp.]MDO9421012.1 enolase C-terminal domain-like protein [Herminiimonas sp.]